MIIKSIVTGRLCALFAVIMLGAACKKSEGPSTQDPLTPEASPTSETNVSEPTSRKSGAEDTRNARNAELTKVVEDQSASVVAPVKPLAADETPKEVGSPPEIVADPASIELDVDGPRPKVGDKIYSWKNLPDDACGEYWIKGSNGKVGRVAVCRDEH